MHIERDAAEQDNIELKTDKIEQENIDNAMAWADEEEAKELAEIDQQNVDPTQDPANIEWMNEQIEQAKELYGDSFGEDISKDFTDGG